MDDDLAYPGEEQDVLYDPTYLHKHHVNTSSSQLCSTCAISQYSMCRDASNLPCASLGCSISSRKTRSARSRGTSPQTLKPAIHFGAIGSSNVLMRSGVDRDAMAVEDAIIALEMEGAGAWDNVASCIIIKAVCDYADSHKNKEWQQYAATVSACGVKAFLQHWNLSEKTKHSTSRKVDSAVFAGIPSISRQEAITRNEHWMIPRPASNIFTGRSETIRDIMSVLQEHLDDSYPSSPCRMLLNGMAGIGKSEMCLHIANKMRQSFWGVFWVDISSHESARADFLAIAARIGKSCNTIAAVISELDNTKNHWLLILDNADNAQQDYQVYLPTGVVGCTLITSRLRDRRRLAATEDLPELQEMSAQDSAQLLLKAARISAYDNTTIESDIQAICDRLGRHPLAIIQAGSFMALEQCSLSYYLAKLERRHAGLLQQSSDQGVTNYQNVYARFEDTLHAILSSRPETAAFVEQTMTTLSFLSTARIPLNMFRETCKRAMNLQESRNECPDVRQLDRNHAMTIITYFNSKSGQSSLRISEKDSKTSKIRLRRTKSAFDSPETCKFDDKLIRSVVGTLSSAALVNRNSKGDSQDLHLHTLVRYWASTRLAKSSRHAAWFRAASLVCITSENPGKHIWSDYEVELRTHAQALLSYPADFMYQQGSPDAVSRLIYRLLTLVTTNINVPESKHAGLIECTLDRLGQKRGRPSLEYFPLYNLLADKYMEQGRYEDAVQTLKGTLTTVERGLDTRQQDNFGDLIRTQIQLGEAYRTLGSYDQASALLEAALKRQSRRASQNDADIRKIQQLLAVTYMQAGQSSRAIALLLLVVDELSSTEGRGSSDLLEARFTLGKAFLGAGRHQEAVDILRSLVSSYPSFSSSNSVAPDPRYHLARALLLGNQADAALELLSQVRINRDQRNDRQTALSRLVDGEMARCHLHLGDGIQAYKLFNQVFEQSGTNSGIAGVGLPRFEDELLDDFLVANVKNDVPAKTLDLAVKHLERRLATATHARTDVLQRITATKLRLAIVYRLDRQYRSAIRLLEGILETLTTAEKPDTKQMSLCRYNLSKCLVAQEHPTSAKQAISHLRAFIQVLDTNQVNPYTGQHVDALFELSRAYHIAKDFRQAVNMLEEAMDLAQGDDHILKNDRVRLFKDIVSGLLARKSHGRAADLLARAVARQQGSGTAQDEIAQDVVADYQKRIKQSIADLKTQFMEQVTIHEASQASNSDSEEDISD